MSQSQPSPSVCHIRTYCPTSGKVGNNGGATIAYRPVPNGQGVEYAVAYCSPRDNFSRAVGRAASTGRLNTPLASTTLSSMTLEQFEAELHEVKVSDFADNWELSSELAEKFGAPVPAAYIRR